MKDNRDDPITVYGFHTWRCNMCGESGHGQTEELFAHVNAHPKFRDWLSRRLMSLARASERCAYRVMRAAK